MIITNITDLASANKLIIDPILSGDSTILPLDSFVHACIIGEHIEFLRRTTESVRPYDESVADFVDQHGVLDNDPSGYGITAYPDQSQVVYPFSKTQFFKTFYSNIIPSVANAYFNYMKNTNRILQIGAGVGKCLLIKPVYFTEEDITIINSLDVSYSEMSQLLVQATNHLAKQEADIKFLVEKLEVSQSYSRFLEKKAEILESQLINNTMHTWR
jgi:hypothetical protein